MSTCDFDLLILGAGPAGLAAATVAARAGLRVQIVERSQFPRHRPGETLHPGVEPLLRQLAPDDPILGVAEVRHAGVWTRWNEALKFTPFGSDAEGPWRGFQILRSELDAALLQAAVAEGAAFCQGTARHVSFEPECCVMRIDDEELQASFLIDAAGDRHWLAKELAIPVTPYSRPLEARYGYIRGCCPARDNAPLMAADEQGWTWSARIGDGLYQWTRVNLNGSAPDDWRPVEFQGLTDDGHVRGANVTWRIAERVAGERFFLAGDAAAVLDPASSHGVLRALMSGMLAGHLTAKVVQQETDGATAAAHYQPWLTRWFHHDREQLTELYHQAFSENSPALPPHPLVEVPIPG